MRHALFLTLLLTALLGVAAPARAAEEKAANDKDWAFPKADAKDTWREVRQESSTSTCIGSMATPLCVLDTVMACLARSGDLCRQLFDDPKRAETYIRLKRLPNQYYRYRYLGATTVQQDGQGGFPERKEDDVIMYFRYWTCGTLDTGRSYCDKPFSGPPMELTIRRDNNAWRNIFWSAPGPR